MKIFQFLTLKIALIILCFAPAKALDFDIQSYEKKLEEINQIYLKEGTDVAVPLLLKLEKEYRLSDGDDSIAVANLIFQRGFLLILEDKDEEAIELIDQSIAIYEAKEDTPLLYYTTALINRSSAKRGLVQFQQALIDAEKALMIAEERAPSISLSRQIAYQEYADVLNGLGYKQKALNYRLKAIKIATERDENLATIISHITGIAYTLLFEYGKPDEALVFLDSMAPPIFDGYKGTNDSLARLYTAYASAYARLNNIEKAREYHFKGIAEYKRLQKTNIKNANFFSGEAIVRHNLGRSYYEQGLHAEAREQFDLMATILDETLPENHPIQISGDRSRALNMIALGDDEGAKLLLEQYEKFVTAVRPTELRLIVWQGDIANYYAEKGDIDLANEYYELALQGLLLRAKERRVDAYTSIREWEGQREIQEGYIFALADKAGI